MRANGSGHVDGQRHLVESLLQFTGVNCLYYAAFVTCDLGLIVKDDGKETAATVIVSKVGMGQDRVLGIYPPSG